MAVIVKYIVVRDGVEKMTFTTKKEADAYDRMLDIADDLYDYIETANLGIDETRLEELTLFIARNKDHVMSLLKGSAPKDDSAESGPKAEAPKPKKKSAAVKDEDE
jgi:dsDNA-binding SOS-regulon protein